MPLSGTKVKMLLEEIYIGLFGNMYLEWIGFMLMIIMLYSVNKTLKYKISTVINLSNQYFTWYFDFLDCFTSIVIH